MARFPDVPPFSNPALFLELIFDSKLVGTEKPHAIYYHLEFEIPVRILGDKNRDSYVNN